MVVASLGWEIFAGQGARKSSMIQVKTSGIAFRAY